MSTTTHRQRDRTSIRLRSAYKDANLAEMVGGAKPFLWVGNDDRCFVWISGDTTLRKIADAIYDHLGDQ